jgi:two-component system NtrC family sensor kinase
MANAFDLRSSLQLRILGLTVLIVASVLSVGDYFVTKSSIRVLEEEIGDLTHNAAQNLAHALGGYGVAQLETPFHRTLARVLELVPNITRADVYMRFPEGLQLVTSSLKTVERTPEPFELSSLQEWQADTFQVEEENGPRTIVAVEPLRLQDGREGFVTVISSLKPVKDLTDVHARFRLYSLGSSILLLVLGISLVFRATVVRSVRHLVGVMHRFQAGQTAVRVQERLPGEFGELAVHLNEMLSEVGQFHENLQFQIQAATTALAKRNQELEALNLLLFDTQKHLVQAERLSLIGQLTATFAHEIGSPLSAVSTHLQLLQENPGLAPATRERVQLVDAEINRIIGIVENLLSNARSAPQRTPLDLQEVVRRVIQLLGPTLRSRRTEVVVEADPGQLRILGNPDQLEQLFLNLCNNALDAMAGPGRITLALHRLPAERPEAPAHVQVQVRDSGAGIPADRLPHIFEPFFTTKEFGKGSGLGLAVSREIVRQHGGRIGVQSPPGEGAAFTLELPECPPGAAAETCEEASLS